MTPGRELDALIAEKVMGLVLEEELGFCYPDGKTSFGNSPEYTRQKCENYARQGFGTKLITRKLPPAEYSTDISAAWEVVEKLMALEPEVSWNDEIHCWVVNFQKHPDAIGSGDTAPHAICLAALKAVGGGTRRKD